MLRTVSEFGGISAGDPDPVLDAEVANGVREELSSTLRAIEQDQLDLGPVESDDQAWHSPTAAHIAPELT